MPRGRADPNHGRRLGKEISAPMFEGKGRTMGWKTLQYRRPRFSAPLLLALMTALACPALLCGEAGAAQPGQSAQPAQPKLPPQPALLKFKFGPEKSPPCPGFIEVTDQTKFTPKSVTAGWATPARPPGRDPTTCSAHGSAAARPSPSPCPTALTSPGSSSATTTRIHATTS